MGIWSAFSEVPGPDLPLVWGVSGREGPAGKGETVEDGGASIVSGGRSGPRPASEGDAQGRETGPVARGGTGIGVGGDPDLAPHPGFAATPGSAHEVSDLAFYLRTGARIRVCQSGSAWATLCAWRMSSRAWMFTVRPAVDAVHEGRSAQPVQAPGEVRPTRAVFTDADRGGLPGRAGDGARFEIDSEVVLAEQPVASPSGSDPGLDVVVAGIGQAGEGLAVP